MLSLPRLGSHDLLRQTHWLWGLWNVSAYSSSNLTRKIIPFLLISCLDFTFGFSCWPCRDSATKGCCLVMIAFYLTYPTPSSWMRGSRVLLLKEQGQYSTYVRMEDGRIIWFIHDCIWEHIHVHWAIFSCGQTIQNTCSHSQYTIISDSTLLVWRSLPNRRSFWRQKMHRGRGKRLNPGFQQRTGTGSGVSEALLKQARQSGQLNLSNRSLEVLWVCKYLD